MGHGRRSDGSNRQIYCWCLPLTQSFRKPRVRKWTMQCNPVSPLRSRAKLRIFWGGKWRINNHVNGKANTHRKVNYGYNTVNGKHHTYGGQSVWKQGRAEPSSQEYGLWKLAGTPSSPSPTTHCSTCDLVSYWTSLCLSFIQMQIQ